MRWAKEVSALRRAELADAMLTTFEGGCTPATSFGSGDGPNDYADLHAAAFPAPETDRTSHRTTYGVPDRRPGYRRRLGLYRVLADGGAQTADELAKATDCHPRLVREWLGAR